MPPDRLVTIGSVERILHLKRLPMLGGLAARDLAVLAEYLHERVFPAGAALLRETEPAGAVYFVIDGTVQVTRRGQPFGVAGPGWAIGALPLLARAPEGLGATATTPVVALELDGEALSEVFEDHFSILRHVVREVSSQLIEFQKRNPAQHVGPPPRATPLAPASRDLDLVERIFLVRQAAPFRRSSINALAELSRGLTEARLEPGVTLWREGDAGGWMLLIVNGAVDGSSASRGQRFSLGPGSPLGILEGLSGRPRWFEAVTATRVVALQGHVEGLLDVFEDNPEIALDYLAVMSRWLLRALEQDPVFRVATFGLLQGGEGEG
jgi:CRP/FNR family transcriptional regulator, cyclic AMP receptor protein